MPIGVHPRRLFPFRFCWLLQPPEVIPMEKTNSSVAEQIAEAAAAFEQQRTGHRPSSVSVVLGEDVLVVTLHGALSPAERALATNPAGAAYLQEFHRELFLSSSASLRQEI